LTKKNETWNWWRRQWCRGYNGTPKSFDLVKIRAKSLNIWEKYVEIWAKYEKTFAKSLYVL